MLKIKPGKECLVAALSYAGMGWAVIPLHGITEGRCCTCGNPECNSAGKHPRIKDWPNQASTDATVIRSWFTKWPDSNIGIITGAKSQIVVVDSDGPEGEASMNSLALPPTVQVKTRRGRHLYFRHPGWPVKNFVKKLPGLDLRADGGCVVAPPSRHAEGEYEWAVVRTFAQFPDALVRLCQAEQKTQQQGAPGRIPEGQRNSTLFQLGAAMRRYGCNQQTIDKTLRGHNLQACDPPLSDDEVKRIAASAARYDAVDSIRPPTLPQGLGADESHFAPVDLDEFLSAPQEETDWIIPGYLAAGRATLLGGPPKIGKTTLAYEGLVHVARGGLWLGRRVRHGKVLVLALEEHRQDISRRFRMLNARQLHKKIKVVVGRLEFSTHLLDEIVNYVNKESITLVMVDTLPMWWNLTNENDASEVIRYGGPLIEAIRKTQAAWLLLAHTRKSGGQGGEEIRGSSALVGLVDMAVSMKRNSAEAKTRVLQAVSRLSETPAELLVRLTDSGYVAVGTPAQVLLNAKVERVLAVLNDGEPHTAEGLAKLTTLSKQDVSRTLDVLHHQVVREGNGRKGDPFRYRIFHSSTEKPLGRSVDESNADPEEETINVD